MRYRKGFTLVELLFTILVIGIVGAAMVSLLRIPIKANQMSEKEFNLQSELRVTSETINNSVRNATAAFLLSKKPASPMTPKWHYLICEKDDKTSTVVLYKWSGTNHVKQVLAEASSTELDYSIEFETSNSGQLLTYNILAKHLENDRLDKLSSEIKPLNSFNIIDNSKIDEDAFDDSIKKYANCLAFRTDIPDPKMGDEVGYDRISVTLVLDLSGSMKSKMKDKAGKWSPRVEILEKAVRYILEKFQKTANDKIDIKIVPYSEIAFDVRTVDGTKVDFSTYRKKEYSSPSEFLGLGPNRVGIKRKDGTPEYLIPLFGTNTGDGMREGYYAMKEYNKKKLEKNSKLKIKNYVLILTDGMANQITAETVSEGSTPLEMHMKSVLFSDYSGEIKMDLTRKNLEIDRDETGVDLIPAIKKVFRLTPTEENEIISREGLYLPYSNEESALLNKFLIYYMEAFDYRTKSLKIQNRDALRVTMQSVLKDSFDEARQVDLGSGRRIIYRQKYHNVIRYDVDWKEERRLKFYKLMTQIVKAKAGRNFVFRDQYNKLKNKDGELLVDYVISKASEHAVNSVHRDNAGFWHEKQGLKYATLIGEMIAHYKTANLTKDDQGVGVTVIGFASSINELQNCDAIGKACNAIFYDGKQYLLATSPEELSGAFDKFSQQILDKASLWYIGGPE